MNRSSSKADIGIIRRGRALIHRFVPGDIAEIIEDAWFEFDRVAIDIDHRIVADATAMSPISACVLTPYSSSMCLSGSDVSAGPYYFRKS